MVSLGSKVLIKDLQSGDVDEYTLVGSTEADPFGNKISNESPVGKAVLGQKAGQVVTVAAPIGILKYQIVSIQH
jgi:transcription elongation factor GreA